MFYVQTAGGFVKKKDGGLLGERSGDKRCLIPASGLFGACLLLSADIIARVALAPVLLPVGAITALLGGPMLIYLMLRRKRDCCGL